MTRGQGPGLLDLPWPGSRRGGAAIKVAWSAAVRWKTSVSFALLDQGLSSIANFVLAIIAARAMPIDEFGRYAVVWALALLIQCIANALANDPLPAVLGPHDKAMRRRLIAIAIWFNLAISCGLSCLVLVGALASWQWFPQFGGLLACLAIVSPVQQLQQCNRRLCYLEQRQDVAAGAAGAAAMVLVSGTVAMWLSDECTAARLVLLWGAAALTSCTVGMAAGILRFAQTQLASLKELARECLTSGRWLVGASIAVWLGAYSFPMIAIVMGPTASGILRAQQTLFIPATQFTVAVSMVLLPSLVEIRTTRGHAAFRRTALGSIATFVAVAAGYSAVIVSLGSSLLSLVYNRPEITSSARLLWPFAIVTVLEAAIQAMATVLVASVDTRTVFLSRMVSVPVLLGGAAWLGPTMGIGAVTWVMAASSAICASMYGMAFVRLSSRFNGGEHGDEHI